MMSPDHSPFAQRKRGGGFGGKKGGEKYNIPQKMGLGEICTIPTWATVA